MLSETQLLCEPEEDAIVSLNDIFETHGIPGEAL